MNTLAAAKDTLELARQYYLQDLTSDMPELDYTHLAEMVTKMETTEMSPTKMSRWLGWIQAAVVSNACGRINLDAIKQINKKWAD